MVVQSSLHVILHEALVGVKPRCVHSPTSAALLLHAVLGRFPPPAARRFAGSAVVLMWRATSGVPMTGSR